MCVSACEGVREKFVVRTTSGYLCKQRILTTFNKAATGFVAFSVFLERAVVNVPRSVF